MTREEIERAYAVDRNTYPQDCPCIHCGYRWMQHVGAMCPEIPGHLRTINGKPFPVQPTIAFTTTFIPDLDYYKQPDFDVV